MTVLWTVHVRMRNGVLDLYTCMCCVKIVSLMI